MIVVIMIAVVVHACGDHMSCLVHAVLVDAHRFARSIYRETQTVRKKHIHYALLSLLSCEKVMKVFITPYLSCEKVMKVFMGSHESLHYALLMGSLA